MHEVDEMKDLVEIRGLFIDFKESHLLASNLYNIFYVKLKDKDACAYLNLF